MAGSTIAAGGGFGALPRMVQYVQGKLAGREMRKLTVPDDGALTRAKAMVRRYAGSEPGDSSPGVVQEFRNRNFSGVDLMR